MFGQTQLFPNHEPEAEMTFYVNDGTVQTGCVYKPPGKGPFPVVIFNQATPKPSITMGDTKPFYPLAKYYTARGVVLFLPGRPLLQEPTGENSGASENVKFMESMDRHNENITAALDWLKAQSFADPKQIIMSGHSTGAIQTLLLAEEGLGVQAFVAFSPAAKMLATNPLLQEALVKAVRNAKAPIFLIQPQNDHSLKPIELLGPELTKRGQPNRTKIFDVPSASQMEANSFAFNMPNVWGEEVFAFLAAAARTQTKPSSD